MPAKYSPAPAVREIAEALINDPENRKQFGHLLDNDVRIEYLFSSEYMPRLNKEVLANARLVTGINAFLSRKINHETGEVKTERYFVITVHETMWKYLWNDNTKNGIVCHELCHLWSEEDEDGETVLKLLGHDIDEFMFPVQKFGRYLPDVGQFVDAVREATNTPEETQREEEWKAYLTQKETDEKAIADAKAEKKKKRAEAKGIDTQTVPMNFDTPAGSPGMESGSPSSQKFADQSETVDPLKRAIREQASRFASGANPDALAPLPNSPAAQRLKERQ